jgi:putative membrane protein
MEKPTEPNPKAALSDYLAAERTFLAWIRTGLALMGFGFVVARFGLFLQKLAALGAMTPQKDTGFSLWFGTVLIAVGVLLNLFAGFHHVRVVRTLDSGETPRSHSTAQAIALAIFLAVVGLAMALYLVLLRV